MKQISKNKGRQSRRTFAQMCAAAREDNARTAFQRARLAARLTRAASHRSRRLLVTLARAAVERAFDLTPGHVAVEIDGCDFVARFGGLLGFGLPTVVRLSVKPWVLRPVA